MTPNDVVTAAIDCLVEDILDGASHIKSEEKKSSMIQHFNHFLTMRMININSKAIIGREIKDFKDITYNDLDKTKLPGEFATYLAKRQFVIELLFLKAN